MKKRTKIIIALAVACAGTLVLGACADRSPYTDLAKGGYDVRVHFDANGGWLAGQENVGVVNVFKYEDVEKGVMILAPDDTRLGSGNFMTVSRTGYFFAGWYANRELRTNEDGEPVDEDGNICVRTPVLDVNGDPVYEGGRLVTELLSENGKGQGYIYSDKWDFDEKLTADRLTKTNNGYDFTLYAAWVPNFKYQIFAEIEGEWQIVATASYNPTLAGSADYQTIPVPAWNSETGALDYGNFPKATYSAQVGETTQIRSLTFSAVYADKEKTTPLEKIEHHGSLDEEHAISLNGIQNYYGEFLEGNWFRIHTAEQFANNLSLDSCFEIYEDLDFTGVEWPSAFVTGSYAGIIHGNHHTISNISAMYSGSDATYAGLFGRIQSAAVFEDVTFKDVNFTLQRGSTKYGATFGLFAGTIDAGATFRNVEVSGKFYIGTEDEANPFVPQNSYQYIIRPLVGNENEVAKSLDDSNVELIGVGNVTLTKNDDGSVTATVTE